MAQNDLLSIIQAEIDDSIGYIESETVEQRKQALEAYLRSPYGNEVEGKSQIVTGEVAEAIDGATLIGLSHDDELSSIPIARYLNESLPWDDQSCRGRS